MAARVKTIAAGRNGRPFRRSRAKVLAVSRTCWLCGHDGSDSVDHVIPRAICLANGWKHLLDAEDNLRPAHHRPCPDCGQRCNRKRGTGIPKPTQVTQSRAW